MKIKLLLAVGNRPESERISSDQFSKTIAGRAHGLHATFHVTVVSRSVQAVNYKHRSGATKLEFAGTDLMPQPTAKPKWKARRATSKSKWNLATCRSLRLSAMSI